jgi:trimethylamine:corrinoid methyltransferase-like protein
MKVKQTKLSDDTWFTRAEIVLNLLSGGLLSDDYKQRKVSNTKTKFGVIDTCYASDTGFYETGIIDIRYYSQWIIVDECKTEEEAKEMHKKWIKILRNKILPNKLKDIHLDEYFYIK